MRVGLGIHDSDRQIQVKHLTLGLVTISFVYSGLYLGRIDVFPTARLA